MHRFDYDRGIVQVVRKVNPRTGAQLNSGAIANPNGRGAAGTTCVEDACGLYSVHSMLNESTLYSIGAQYARDILKFGWW